VQKPYPIWDQNQWPKSVLFSDQTAKKPHLLGPYGLVAQSHGGSSGDCITSPKRVCMEASRFQVFHIAILSILDIVSHPHFPMGSCYLWSTVRQNHTIIFGFFSIELSSFSNCRYCDPFLSLVILNFFNLWFICGVFRNIKAAFNTFWVLHCPISKTAQHQA